MKILSRYVFREITSSALLGIFLATFVVFLQSPAKKLLEILVRTSATPQLGMKLFLLAIPPLLPLTVPFGVLVGILIGLGRMASDGEITAIRAGGASSRLVTPPVVVFCLLAGSVAAMASLWLTPYSVRTNVRVINRMAAEQVTAQVLPRVFSEDFPKKVLYVGDVKPGPPDVWRNVFMADTTPAEERPMIDGKQMEGPKITIAQQAIAVPDVKHNRIQLRLRNSSAHEIAQNGEGYHSQSPTSDQVLDVSPPPEVTGKRLSGMPTPELYRLVKKAARKSDEGLEARLELHTRIALPFACLMLGLVGIPLGVQSRKGGKSSGYVTAIFLSFFCYYLSFITLTGMARRGAISVELATWLPNAVFFVAGVIFIARLERPGDRDILGTVRVLLSAVWHKIYVRPAQAAREVSSSTGSRIMMFQILDAYVLSQFLFYFVVWLASFVALAQTYFFFELFGDIFQHKIPLTKVFTYLFFLTPKLIYDTLPISVLVGVLVTFAVLTKNNEVTAFKACGVSVRRLGLPVIILSVLLSVGLFAFDHYYVPAANLKQDALRNEIKGRPVQTYLRPDRKWIYGSGSRIYYYKIFDTTENVMVGASVYEIDPVTFTLRKAISAERARWQPSLRTWIFENGWSRDLRGTKETGFTNFQVKTFPELDEPPNYFIKEVKQDKQMNYIELQSYIRDLKQSGFDTVPLQVQLHKKFSMPMFALIMAMISVPFGFLVGRRGAMAGIGVSIAVAMAYWGVDKFFEQLGNVNHLPPAVAAWAPDALFALAGTYLLLRMR
ncbi:MAG: permease YjgP/YjgQ family protein, partial [Bryobacterales bacterium]|nr:permease YjgP/YjgQ family protein [Bryobacterales bacterium]